MKGIRYIYVILLSLLLLSATGCFKDDFSTSPDHILTFSIDTLKFDTVFTEQGTPTSFFKVYNNNDKSLLVSSIVVADASNSGFFINVDGSKGPDVYGIEIPAHDSIFVFIELTPKKSNQNLPFLIKDSVVFLTNGVAQDVKLQAYGQDATRMKGEVITTDTEFTPEKPYIIFDSLVVEEGAKLKLQAGVTLYMHDKAKVIVRGQILAEGTNASPVTFRGDRTDNMFSYLPYDRLPGQWDGIYIGEKSYENKFVHTRVRGVLNGLVLDSSDVSMQKIVIHNSVLHNSKNNLLTINHSKVDVTNSEISNASGSLIRCNGGELRVVQSTLANYFSLFDVVRQPLIVYNGFDNVDLPYIPSSAIDNSIVIGSAQIISPSDISSFTNIVFRNCMFGVKGSDDANFINSVWGGVPMFNCVGGDIYYYDYRISSTESSVYQMGDESYLTPELRYDMYGEERPVGMNPDIGAYQVVEPMAEE